MNTAAIAPEASKLENMVHIKSKLCSEWQTKELDIYLSQLIMDGRDGDRQGFPVDVMEEILFVAELNKVARAIELSERLKIGYDAAYKKVDLEDRSSKHLDVYDAMFDPRAADTTMVRRAAVRPVEEDDDEGGVTGTVIKVAVVLAVLFILYSVLM